ncbi:Na/Pi symporter [Aquibacillus sp. 3ASR75-11]|uniref:Na/Pi symporter n=1 Tax=Terrihalobacillus insolitus TaxID=2950438 RepID=A0A9X3WX53_9BACI|nr:Na/Pi symporter [Terrihalobacillus insolitus]MDC3413341.1 Na/Pi symporter [Terrihalobacillus insolitus]MDC3424924.1 Na/Pi symporter [Terrihalobacillus insolitus]
MADLLSLTAVFLMIFFLGMSVLRIGLYQLSYNKMQSMLTRFTSSPYVGILTGFIVTAVLQSSSITVVLTIGFVSVGMLTFRQSIGIILGANIGTTVTGELLTMSSLIPAPFVLIIGAILMLLPKRIYFGIGCVLFGIGSIFVALNGFETLTPMISRFTILTDGFEYANENPSIGVLIGTIVTAIIQSSSATIGITMSFLQEELVDITPAIAIVLGANIGTCITALLATIGAGKKTHLVAMAHVWFNIFGVLIFLPFLYTLSNTAILLSDVPREQLAHISVLFNVLTVLLFLPFIHLFERFILFFHGDKQRRV